MSGSSERECCHAQRFARPLQRPPSLGLAVYLAAAVSWTAEVMALKAYIYTTGVMVWFTGSTGKDTHTPFASVGCQRHGEPDGGGGGVEGGRGHEGGAATTGTADVDARKLEEREQGCIDRQLRQQDSMASECQRKMESETSSVIEG